MGEKLKVKVQWNGEKLIAEGSLRSKLSILPELKPLMMTLELYKEPRTLSQNAYFHAIVSWWNRMQREQYGNILTDSQAKDVLKKAVGFYDTIEINGKKGVRPVKVLRDTSRLNKEEFISLIDDINEWCVDHFGVMPPDRSTIDG